MEWQGAVATLLDEYRDRCLWFLQRDYYPTTPEEAQRVLRYIELHGDREAFRRAATLRRWALMDHQRDICRLLVPFQLDWANELHPLKS